MKPSFALDFRDGVIALLHRTTRGWQSVGASPLDAADLGDALAYLRSTALGLSPRGLSTKLVIPNEMILYTQVHAPGPEVAKRRKQIKAALEGLTPYKTDDLVFDWYGTGSEVQVAVVARETLAEAEAFAVEHRFNPVSFVGAPENGSYLGEPFFGPSALSTTLLGEGEKVERDPEPVTGQARAFAKPDDPEPAEEAEPAAPVRAEVPVEVAVEALVAQVAAASAQTPPPPLSIPPLSIPPLPPLAMPDPVAAKTSDPSPAKPAAAMARTGPLPDFSAAKAPINGVASFDPAKLAVDLVDEAPMAVDVADDTPPQDFVPKGMAQPIHAPVEAKADAKPDDDVPPSPSSAVIAAFASRRAAAEYPDDKIRKTPNVGAAPQQRPSVPRPAMAKPAAALPSASRETVPFPGKGAASTSKFPIGKGTKPLNSGQPVPQIKRDRNVVQLPKQPVPGEEALPVGAAKPGPRTETGLDGRPVAPRGKPRYLGLILTALLLLALALVAAWSSYFLTANMPDPVAAPATTGVADGSDALPTVEDEALADGQDAGALDVASPDAALADATLPDAVTPDPMSPDTGAPDAVASGAVASGSIAAVVPDAAALAVAVVPDATVPAAAEVAAPAPEPAPGTLVVTEAAAVPAVGNEPQDEIFLAAADIPPQTSDPLILPQMVSTSDPPPEAAVPPPPFGTQYTFDADGRIQPTPEGIVTPEGVLLIAGRPKIVPPNRPTALTTAVAAPAAGVAAVLPAAAVAAAPGDLGSTAAGAVTPNASLTTAAITPEPVYSDPALADKRPKPRPLGLVDPASATAKQGEVLAPAANSRFAELRPQARPVALTAPVTQVATAENEAAAASLALNGVQPSAAAIAVSKKPAARPSSMDQAVNAAVAAAVRASEPQQQASNVAPEAQVEPEVESAAPALPTNASVAKQATTKDAINLNRVALLGIFGTASGRYAMIRQPTGGVKKVKVGDTLDGGRVAAISANALQYQKGGRMLTLMLPTG